MQKSLFPESDPRRAEKLFLEGIPEKEMVVNRRFQSEDVYIGRGSKWGNPFRIGENGSRMEVIGKYRHYLWGLIRKGIVTPEELVCLDEKKLGCYCSPRPCHGHVLVMAIEWAKIHIEKQGRFFDNASKDY